MNFKLFLVGLIDPIAKLISKFGIAKTVGYLVLALCVCYTVYSVSNFDDVVKKAIAEESEQVEASHDEAVRLRRANTPKINSIMRDAMYEYDADRVCIIEMHNGTNNTAGLPFIYGEMTYEQVRDGISHVDEDYARVNLSRFEIPLYMESAQYWCGSVEELSRIDEKFASRVKANGTTYIAGYLLYGSDNELGYFGLVWCGNEPKNPDVMMKKLAVFAQQISTLLDKK